MLLSELAATGTYVAVVPTPGTQALLQAWADAQCIELDKDLHVTLLFSRKVVQVVPKTDEYVATVESATKFGDSLVLKLICSGLDRRHSELIALGGTHDYPDFIPHLTVQFKSKLAAADLILPDFGLTFWREYTEPLKP